MGSSSLSSTRIAQILYHEEGFLRFWKGANVVASGCIPAHASQFVVYEVLKEKMKYKNESFDMNSTLIIGACSTFAHDIFQTPCDVMKQRMQLCKHLKARQCIRNVLSDEGIKGFFRSYPLTVLMNVPFMSMVVCINENGKTYIKPWEK